MPKVIINAYAILGDILGFRKSEIITSARSIGELIEFLTNNFGTSFKESLIDPKTSELQSSFRILINGRDIKYCNKLKTQILDGDKIIFFPPVSGG